MRRIFLIGVLRGVIMAAAVTFGRLIERYAHSPAAGAPDQFGSIRGWHDSEQTNNRHDAELRLERREMKGYKLIRTFLIGNLCGVIMAAAVALVFTIPANSDHWRMEIWKRGGGAWTFDRNGNIGWMWTVKPTPDPPRKKRLILPSREENVLLERL